MKKIVMVAFLAVILLLPISTKAAYFKVSEKNETIGKDQKLKNAYIAGPDMNVDTDVQKDLAIAGSSLKINGEVQNSLFAAGNNISIKGNVGDSIRACGSNITIESIVSGDVLLAGKDITLFEKSQIDGDLLLVANKAQLKGTVQGNVKLIGADIIISGKIGGDVLVRGDMNLIITKDAVIGGKLIYYSENQANIENGSVITGAIDYHKTQGGNIGWKSYARKISVTFMLYQIIGSLILLFLFAYLAPKNSKKFIEYSYKEVFKNLWSGLLIMVAAPIIALLLIAISFKISFIVILALLLLLAIASVLSALLIGSWLLKTFNKSTEFPLNWQSIVLGVIIMALLPFLPILGTLVMFILLLIALGAISKLIYEGIAQ